MGMADAPEPTARRRVVGPADEETRRRMLAEALKSKAPTQYAPAPMPVAGKGKVRGGTNIRVEAALRAAGA